MTAGTINNPNASPKVAWDDAERFYLYDPSRPTIRDVSERFGVSYLTAHKHATRRRWAIRRKQAERLIDQKAVAQAVETAREHAVARFRRLSRLVDNALDDAAVNTDMLPQILRLIQIERELLESLPPHQSRERVLREQVERALRQGGLLKDN
jgi:hypothetical protein